MPSGMAPQCSLLVQKYGGTAIADAQRLRPAAELVAASLRRGDRVEVAVSAIGNEIDQRPHPRGDPGDSCRPEHGLSLLTDAVQAVC